MTKKILIVDDEPNIVISLEFLMKKEGFEIAVANDGDEALAKVASFNPDLILLDVMMPKKSGFEVCEALRADPSLANSDPLNAGWFFKVKLADAAQLNDLMDETAYSAFAASA